MIVGVDGTVYWGEGSLLLLNCAAVVGGGRKGGHIGGKLHGFFIGWGMDERMSGWMDGWMDEQVSGGADERVSLSVSG